MEPREYWVHDFSPTAFAIESVSLGWYVVFEFLAVLIGAGLWTWQVWRGGRLCWKVLAAFPLGIVAVFVSRLGHCFFYHPGYYFEHPLEALIFWKGGYSSHAAALGLMPFLLVSAKLTGMRVLESLDRFTFTASLGMIFVRLGNFFNSEIVGSKTTVAWAMNFMRYDAGTVARHPVQLYEALLSLTLLIAMLVLDRKLGKEARPTGLLAGVFFAGYFGGRLLLETFKEYGEINNLIYGLTMAQWLSLPFLGFGVWLIIRTLRTQGRVESKGRGSL